MGKVTRPLEPWRSGARFVEVDRDSLRLPAEVWRKGRSHGERPFRVQARERPELIGSARQVRGRRSGRVGPFPNTY